MAASNGDFAIPLANQIQQQAVNISNTGIGMKDVANNGTKVDVETRTKLNLIGTNAITDDSTGDQVTIKLCDRGTSLPASPNDQDEYAYLADATNGIVWRFKYNSGSSSTYKWEFIGGSKLSAAVATIESTTSTSFADIATAGPSVVVPRAGEYYIVEHVQASNSAAGNRLQISVKLGSATAATAEQALALSSKASSGNDDDVCLHRELRPRALAAGDTVKLQYSVNGGTGSFGLREILVWPARVS